MKTDKHRYELESSSTQQRQRRFSRRSTGKNSRSRSNQSDTTSISKFFVKNLEQPQKTKQYNQLIRKTINNTVNWSPPRRQPTPHKTIRQKQINLPKEQLLQEQTRDLTHLRNEIQKHQNYSKKKAKQNDILTKQNCKLKQKIQLLEHELETERKLAQNLKITLDEVRNNCSHKEKMLNYYEKGQNPLKKIKNSIFQSRIEQFQKQRQQLTFKIQELQQTVEDLKTKNSTISPRSSSYFDFQLDFPSPIRSYEDEYTRNIENQLYQSKQEIKKLNIHINCQQRKFFKEMSAFKESKEKDYNNLKQKFADFLKKYKELMKKFTSHQVKNMIEKKKSSKEFRQKSCESLLLSSDEEPPTISVIQ